MTREEWCAYAESVPLTPDQRGAILGHCERLGLTDRAERLAVFAELLGLDDLATTADLTLGQAGRLVNLLQRTRDRDELPDVGEHQADESAEAGDGQDGNEGITWPGVIARIVAEIYAVPSLSDLFKRSQPHKLCG